MTDGAVEGMGSKDPECFSSSRLPITCWHFPLLETNNRVSLLCLPVVSMKIRTTQEESLVVTERLPSAAPCERTEGAMGPCLDGTRELSLVSYCLSRLPGTRKKDAACIETQVLFLNNTSLRKEE